MLQDTIYMVVIRHRMVRDTKYCDIMNWLLSCYEPKGRGFESLLARHVGAKSALLRRLFLPAAQKAAGRVAPLLLLPEKGLARLAYSLASGLGPLWGPFKTDRGGSRDLVYGSLSLTTFFGKGRGLGCFS